MKSKCCAEPTTVVDSRELQDGLSIRRRRECSRCGQRESTREFYSPDKSEFTRLDPRIRKKIQELVDELNRVERIGDDEDLSV